MNRAVIVEAKRTPIGKKNGMLKDYEVQHLSAPLLTFLSKGIEREIDDVITFCNIFSRYSHTRIANCFR